MIVTSEAIEAYLERLRARRDPSEHTVRAYRSDLRDYRAFLATFEGDEAGEAIMAYIRELSGVRRAAIRTMRRRVACLRGFYADIARQAGHKASPFDALELNLPRAKSLPRALAREDAARLARMASAARGRPDLRSREVGTAVLLLLSVGLRVSELVQLKPADFDGEDGSLLVRGKGRRERRVPIVDADLREALARRAAIGAETIFSDEGRPWTPQVFRRHLKAFAQFAEVRRRVTPHMLRHTSATLHLEDGVDLLFLQRMLGHENIATTALYAHVGHASLKRALEQAQLLSSLSAESG